MTTSISGVTIQTAPRDPAHLANIGRFNLRRLAQDLGLIDTEEKKSSFMSASSADMIQAVATALKAHDAKSGGGSAPAAEEPQEAAQQEQEAPPVRQPRTSKAQNVNGTSNGNGNGNSAPASFDANLAKISELIGNAQAELMAHSKLSEAANKRLDALEKAVAGIATAQTAVVALMLMLASQSMEAPPNEILAAALEDAAMVNKTLEGLTKPAGKGGK